MTDHEIDVMKRSIEVQIDEYELSVAEAAEWMRGWKRRRQARQGFRCSQKAEAAQ